MLGVIAALGSVFRHVRYAGCRGENATKMRLIYVNVFDAPELETAAKVSTPVQITGRAHSEICQGYRARHAEGS
jgi:hypothetical protein